MHLNRAVAVGKVHGPAAGLGELAQLADHRALRDYSLLGAVTAQLHWQLGNYEQAVDALEQALAQPCSEPERRLLQRRLEACRTRQAPPPW